MPRAARIMPPQSMIHIIGRGNNDVRLFRNRRDFARFLRIIIKFMSEPYIFVHHYVIMHTHFHVLAWFEQTDTFANIMKGMCLSYYDYYKRKYGYKGHLWHGRFRSIAIKDEAHWLRCGRYIELNPVFAGMCPDPAGYKWSSYHYYASGKNDRLIHVYIEHEETTTRQADVANERYRQYVLDGLDMDYRRQKLLFEKSLSCSGKK